MQDLLSKLYFKIDLYESHGIIFQELFNSLMYNYDNQFHIIQQYAGDKGCDGYSPKLGVHFAVTTQKDGLDTKIEKDFLKYKENPKSNNFIFVYPRDNFVINSSDKIQELQKNNPNIIIEHWGFRKIIDRFMELDINKRKSVLRDRIIPKGNSEEAITFIIIEILKKADKAPFSFSSIGTSTITELSKKLREEDLLFERIKAVSDYKTPKDFFEENIEEREIIRKYIDTIYSELKNKYNDNDVIIWKVMERCCSITEGNFDNLLSIMAIFIEDCTLLKNIDAMGGNNGTP